MIEGWEVEGFISRLLKRDDTNDERLVLEAVKHLRALCRERDALIDRIKELEDEQQ
jgi:hypothetical protein